MTRMMTRGLLIGGLLLILVGAWLLVGAGARAASPVQTVTGAADASHEILVLLHMPSDHFSPDASYGGGYGGGATAGARRRFAQARAKANGLTLVDDWPMPMAGLDCYIMAVPPDRSTEDAAAALSRDPGIEWAEPLRTYKAEGAPAPPGNDPLYHVQPDYRQWRLDALHHLATGRNVRVAIIDSAIEVHHPDLDGQVMLTQNFVPGAAKTAEAHGTGVAGIIAAIAGNGKGIVGVAPEARLMGLRACVQQADPNLTTCDSLSLAKALYFAVDHQAEVINMSLAGPPDPLLGRLIDLAQTHGATVVGAVDRGLPGGGFPASHPGVVAVVDEDAEPTGTGIYGAPGRDIPTTQPGGNWFLVNGSSFAAAHVSGLFALMRQRAHRPQSASALATEQGGDAIDPCATLQRIIADASACDASGGTAAIAAIQGHAAGARP